MSLGLIKPGMSAVYPKWHDKAGEQVEPIGYLKSGKAVWPSIGGAEEQDDPDADPDQEDDEDEDDEDEESSKQSSKKSRKSSKDDDEDDEDDGEDDDPRYLKAARREKRYRLRLREEERKNREMSERLKALEDKGKKPDEIQSRDLADANAKVDRLTKQNVQMAAQLAFFRVNTIDWADPTDAFALAEREGLFEDAVDDDGNVDARELRRGLRDLAKRKPHLVKSTDDPKGRSRKDKDDEDEENDEEPRSRRSAGSMNTKRRGQSRTPDRAALAAKYPVLNRF